MAEMACYYVLLFKRLVYPTKLKLNSCLWCDWLRDDCLESVLLWLLLFKYGNNYCIFVFCELFGIFKWLGIYWRLSWLFSWERFPYLEWILVLNNCGVCLLLWLTLLLSKYGDNDRLSFDKCDERFLTLICFTLYGTLGSIFMFAVMSMLLP